MVLPFPHHTVANWCHTQSSGSSQAGAEDSLMMEDCHLPSKPIFNRSCGVKFWSNSPWKVTTCFLSIWRHISSAPLFKINRAVMEKSLWFSHVPLRPNQALDLSIHTNAIFNCFLSSCAGTCPAPGAAPCVPVQPLPSPGPHKQTQTWCWQIHCCLWGCRLWPWTRGGDGIKCLQLSIAFC